MDTGEIFVSYSRQNSAYVQRLVAYLRDAGLTVWFDEGLTTGERWDRTLRAKIDGCAAFVLVMTPEAEESSWVLEEVDRARAKGRPVLPLLLAGEVFFGLSRTQYDDVTDATLPDAGFVQRLRQLAAAPAPVPVAPAGAEVHSADVHDAAVGPMATRTLHTDAVTAVAYSPRGTMLASGSRDRTVRLEPSSGYGPTHTLAGHSDVVWSLAFTRDGRHLVSAAADGLAIVWDRPSGTVARTLIGHTGPVRSVSCRAGGDIATGAEDATVRVWGAAGTDHRTLSDLDGPSLAVSYSPDGHWLAVGDAGGPHLRHPSGDRASPLTTDAFLVTSLAWSPDSRQLAAAGDDGQLRVYDVASGELVRTMRCHSGRIYSVSWSPDGRRLATGGLTGVARVWRPSTGELVRTLTGHSGRVFGVAYSPGGGQLATVSGDRTTRIWSSV